MVSLYRVALAGVVLGLFVLAAENPRVGLADEEIGEESELPVERCLDLADTTDSVIDTGDGDTDAPNDPPDGPADDDQPADPGDDGVDQP